MIEAGSGQGERLIGGEVGADHIRIKHATGERRYDADGERLVLSGHQVNRLARLGAHIEGVRQELLDPGDQIRSLTG